jgi:hypothetical protein
LGAYQVTKNEYYYEVAQKATGTTIWEQDSEGGLNYMIDFAGERSLLAEL